MDTTVFQLIIPNKTLKKWMSRIPLTGGFGGRALNPLNLGLRSLRNPLENAHTEASNPQNFRLRRFKIPSKLSIQRFKF